MRTAIALAILGVICGAAMAGDLATDPLAYNDGTTTWHGTVAYSNGALSADIDYCVYAPGAFPYPDYVPGANEFAYAYQVFVTGSSSVNKFSVGMEDSNEATKIGSFSLPGGVVPGGAFFGSIDPEALDTAIWTWAGTLPAGQKSAGLVYSSVNAPLWAGGGIHDTGLIAVGDIPSPSNVIPEPATAGLLLGGLLAGLRRRR